MKIFFSLLIIFFAGISYGSDWKSLDGIYAVTAESYLDPPESEAKDSHYRLQIKGESAKDLYNAMHVDETLGDCTGGMLKTINEMRCIHHTDSNTYDCDFSINIQHQTIHYGVAC